MAKKVKKAKEVNKLICPKCGNTKQFHSYGEASVDIIITWDSKKKEYMAQDTGYYLYANGQFTCAKCGEDMDQQVDELDLDLLCEHQVKL